MEIRHMNQNALAARWDISPRTSERWRWAGEGPLLQAGRVVYRLEDVGAFEAKQIRQATPNASRPSKGLAVGPIDERLHVM